MNSNKHLKHHNSHKREQRVYFGDLPVFQWAGKDQGGSVVEKERAETLRPLRHT